MPKKKQRENNTRECANERKLRPFSGEKKKKNKIINIVLIDHMEEREGKKKFFCICAPVSI